MNIAVYCGANLGSRPEYADQAKLLGEWIGRNGHRLVYGAGRYGMMGTVADAVLNNGGEVIGVTPDFFIKNELTHEGLTEVRLVEDLPERRKVMMELSDVFVALPGGVGTLDEISEVMTNNRLHQFLGGSRPAVLLNTEGYYNHLVEFLRHMVNEDYYDQSDLDAIIVADSVDSMADALNNLKDN